MNELAKTPVSRWHPQALAAARPGRFSAVLIAVALPLAGCFDSGGAAHSPQPPPPPTQREYGLAVADFNGDGLPDVISADTTYFTPVPEAGNLSVYLHAASASAGFASPVTYSTGTEPLFLASGDLNGDGRPDVVAASFDDATLSVYLNSAAQPGTFGAPLVLPSAGASQVVIADVNGDGLPDLVSADYSVSLFLNNPASPGTFLAPLGLYPGGANWVAVGDLNGDGIADIALTDAVGVKVLMHTGAVGTTTYAAAVSVFNQTLNPQFNGANAIAIADVDGDGFNDLVITDPGPPGGAAPTVSVLLQDKTHPGQFLAPVSYAIASNNLGENVVVSDLNGDGHPDIVVGGSGAVTVLLQDPAHAGLFLAGTSYATPAGAFQLGIADVNGDGHPDIVVTNGATTPVQNGVTTRHPGVLLQSAGAPGTFGPLQDLP